jgi:hypothetical protein
MSWLFLSYFVITLKLQDFLLTIDLCCFAYLRLGGATQIQIDFEATFCFIFFSYVFVCFV